MGNSQKKVVHHYYCTNGSLPVEISQNHYQQRPNQKNRNFQNLGSKPAFNASKPNKFTQKKMSSGRNTYGYDYNQTNIDKNLNNQSRNFMNNEKKFNQSQKFGPKIQILRTSEKNNISSYQNNSYQKSSQQVYNKMIEAQNHNAVNQINQLNQQQKQLKQIIKDFEEKIQKAKQHARLMNDPDKFDEFKAKALDIYIQRLKQLQIPENIVGEDRKCTKLIIGKISAGKSSLLNILFNLKLQVGMGQTTKQGQIVYQIGNIVIWDTPGQNQDFNTQNIQNLGFIGRANQVFILYPDSLKNAEHLVRVITCIKPNTTVLVRTKCDLAQKTDSKTIQEQIEQDRRILKRWGLTQNIPIFATSSKKINLLDNQKVKQLITQYPAKKQKFM